MESGVARITIDLERYPEELAARCRFCGSFN
jgi:hypothetical protein